MRLYLGAFLLALIPDLLGCKIKLDQYEPLLAMIVGISGAIFTIMGIWIAHLYPNIITALKAPKIINADFSSGKKDSKKLNTIIGVIIISSLNMAFSVAFAIIIAIYESLGFKAQEIVLWILQSGLLTISITQLFAIASVIWVCSEFVKTIHSASISKEHDADA